MKLYSLNVFTLKCRYKESISEGRKKKEEEGGRGLMERFTRF
jgi:hypothetical protein